MSAKKKEVAKAGESPEALLRDLRALIREARGRVAQAVNAGLVLLYWHVGARIRQGILGEKRAEYGKQILYALSRKLIKEFGTGFSERNLSSMVQFAEVFPNPEIAHTLCAQLSWSHLRQIIYLKDDLQRDFYSELCRVERWSVRTLQAKIQGMLYERTALSQKPEELIRKELAALREEDRLTPDLVFRDPYVLDFLGLKDTCGEKDLEAAILWELESFLLELGAGFTFVARQKRMTVGETDYYLDLDRSGIRVAAYLTELPPREVLARKLHDALLLARGRLSAGSEVAVEGAP